MSTREMSRRRFLRSALVWSSAAGLAACAGTPAPATVAETEVPAVEGAAPTAAVEGAAPTAAGEAISLRWTDEIGFAEPGIEEKWNAELAAEFTRRHPGVYVTWEPRPDLQKMTAMFASGTAPDIPDPQSEYFRGWVDRGLLLDLNPLLEKNNLSQDVEDFYPAPVQTSTVEGKLYALPKYLNVVITFYNKDAYDEAGLEYPTDEWTHDDFRLYANQLTVKEGETTKRWGLTSGVTGLSRIDIWAIWAFCGDLMDPDDPTKCIIDQPEAVQGLQYVHDLIWKDQCLALSEALGGMGGREAYLAQMVAEQVDGSGHIQDYHTNAPFDQAFISMPVGPCGSHPRTSLNVYSIYSGTKYPDEAFQFLAYLTSPEVCEKRMKDIGNLSPRRSQSELVIGLLPDQPMESVVHSMEIARCTPYYALPKAMELVEILNPLMEECLVLNKRPIQECMTEAAQKITALYQG